MVTTKSSDEIVEAIRHILAGDESQELAGGQLRVIRTDLPHHAVVSIARRDQGAIWLIMNADVPDVRAHLQQLLTHWPDDVDQQVRDWVPPDAQDIDDDMEPGDDD